MGVKTRNLGNSEGKDIQWQTPLNADGSTIFDVEAGKGYFVNTTGGEVELKLPTGSIGDRIAVMDFGGTFNTNPIRLNLNGQKLNGSLNPSGTSGAQGYVKIETQNVRFELVFSDSDKGWVVFENEAKTSPSTSPFASYTEATGGTITTSGDFKIHTFTGDGCFVVSGVGNPIGSGDAVDYLVVAGGGGGARDNAGGGGAGGVRFFASPDIPAPGYPAGPRNAPAGITVTATTFPITVGAGGGPGNLPGSGDCAPGQRGSNSVFSTITSTGGGGSNGDGQPFSPKMPGGSGGGEGQGAGTKGIGNTPPVSPSQGSDGGQNNNTPGGGGGGGGFMAVGSNNSGDSGGAGGVGGGFPTAFVGTNGVSSSCQQFFGGGGGGGNGQPGGGTGGSGGTGGGGAGSASAPTSITPGVAGTANTGGGGGGGGQAGEGSSGGKGIVILRYKFQN